ncbi:MAG: PIN domain-containing protein [Bacteroidales bacterium]|nr:PIN domain-containing protein [Bacteroidales bacterium]MCF8454681.1 PIN domain-containing protein [Bacteroidales bacterium]
MIDIEKSIFVYQHIYISLITYIEVLGYNFKDEKEKALTTQIIGLFEIINPDLKIADLTIGYRKIKKVKVPDAIILATARRLDAELLTSNTTDFINIDEMVRIVEPVKQILP